MPGNTQAAGARFVALAMAAGALGGVGAIFLHVLLALLHNLFFLGKLSIAYDLRVHTPASPLGALIVFVPVVGGAAGFFIANRFAPESRGSGVPDILGGVFYRQGRIRVSGAFFHPVVMALGVGSGGSAGCEGPSMHVGAALASGFAEMLGLDAARRAALVACGTAAGIAACFNAPWGGCLFALEIATLEWRLPVILAVLAASWAATLISRASLGNFSLLPAVVVHPGAPETWWGCLALATVAGLLAWAFIVAVHRCQRRAADTRCNRYVLHGVAMLGVGIMVQACFLWTGHYDIEGVGYATVGDLLAGPALPAAVLLALFAAKFLATVLTLGTGGSGGIFSSSLFLGAALGAGAAAAATAIGLSVQPALWVVAGMAGMASATTGAVLGSSVMLLEMSGQPGIAGPVLLAAVAAYAVRRLLLAQSGYTRGLADGAQPVPENGYARLRLGKRRGRPPDL